MRVERHPETGQLVLWCLGEAHADVVLERLRATGAHVDTVPLQIALRETFTAEARGHGRLVKQSGGHGQYAVCDVIVSPLPRGSGIQFAEKVVGGAVPSQFIGSVEKGVRAQLEQGLHGDHVPMVDVLVTLVDGKAHSVDSSDAAFQHAGALAVKDAAAAAAPALLEPLATVDDHRARRARRRGPVGPVRPPRPGDRHRARPVRAGRHGAHRRARRGAGRGADALRDHAALAHGRHRPVRPAISRATRSSRPTSPTRCGRRSPPDLAGRRVLPRRHGLISAPAGQFALPARPDCPAGGRVRQRLHDHIRGKPVCRAPVTASGS